jgi:Domain of unknown function (DUF4249)
MTPNAWRIVAFNSLLFLLADCTIPYNPPTINGTNQFLTVDGIIRNGQDSTIFLLSRSATFGSSVGPQPELSAQVTIVGQTSGTIPLINLGNGAYGIDHLNLDPSQDYQLKVTSSNGEQYASDFVPVRQSPPIDSLHWEADSVGVSIYVNTHDPQNNTRYYQWDFTQTGEHRVLYNSSIELQPDGSKILRPEDQQIYRCWTSNNSTSILVTSTAALSQDVVSEYLVNSVNNGSFEISFTYSILVRQYAITQQAYQYWQDLKQNTELTGGLFQPQPSSVSGNMHCLTHPNEPVFGYISASSETSARLFIHNAQLNDWNYLIPDTAFCVYWVPEVDSLPFYYTMPNVVQPFLLCYPGTPICVVALAHLECIDCRYWGGTNVKPAYWPN